MSILLSTDSSRSKLHNMLSENNAGTILSAFFSDKAHDWLSGFGLKKLTIVIRGRVSDFLSGASSLDALEKLHSAGFEVKINLELHAKLFWFGNQMLLGSSNLTSNGFNLLESGGNIELNSVINSNDDNICVVQSIVDRSQTVDQATITRMRQFIDEKSEANDKSEPQWPQGLIGMAETYLKVHNFPRECFDDCALTDTGNWGEIARLWKSKKQNLAAELFQKTSVFKWLLDQIELEQENSLRFGKVSSLLHTELSKDPVLFRYEIKELQSHLYSFLREVETDIFISIPGRRSEVIKKR